MTNCTCIKCNKCGSISVVLTKELWKLGQCPKCESKDLVNLNEDFDLVDVLGGKDSDVEEIYSK